MIRYYNIWQGANLLKEAWLRKILRGAVVHTVNVSLRPAERRLDRLLQNNQPVKFIIIKLWNCRSAQTNYIVAFSMTYFIGIQQMIMVVVHTEVLIFFG